MNETISGILLVMVVIILCLFLGSEIKADLHSDGGYEPCKTQGHPLYVDC